MCELACGLAKIPTSQSRVPYEKPFKRTVTEYQNIQKGIQLDNFFYTFS